MVADQKLIQDNSRVGKGNSTFSHTSLGESDQIDNEDMDSSDDDINAKTEQDVEDKAETKEKSAVKKEKVRTTEMRLAVLVLLFLEKFVEISAVFLFTLLAILWKPLYQFLHGICFPLLTFAVFLLVALIVLYRIRWFRENPGVFIYKLIYVHTLGIIFVLLAIHLPKYLTFLSPFFALVALGTIGATYILFAFVCVTHQHFCKVNAEGCALWLYGFVTPIFVLLACQPIYLFSGFSSSVDYSDYITNVGAGVITSLPFIYETLFIYSRFVNSKELQEFVNSKGLVPGFVTTMFGKKIEQLDDDEDKKSHNCQFRIK